MSVVMRPSLRHQLPHSSSGRSCPWTHRIRSIPAVAHMLPGLPPSPASRQMNRGAAETRSHQSLGTQRMALVGGGSSEVVASIPRATN